MSAVKSGERLERIKEQYFPTLTNQQIADWFDISATAVQKWAKGNIPKARVKMLCEKMRISEEWLRYGIGKPFEDDEKTSNAASELESDNDCFAATVWKSLDDASFYYDSDCLSEVWAQAWRVLMKYYPASTFEIEEEFRADCTVTIKAKITIRRGENALTREARNPVTCPKTGKIINNPDALQIDHSTNECLLKCIFLFGLKVSALHN